jgi:nucleotide-binding universal stress UspA family protein
MFTRILIPLDGSTATEKALPIAAQMARTAHGSVTLVHVVTIGTHFNGKPIHCPEALKSTIETEKQKAFTYLMDQAKSPALHDVHVDIDVIWGPVVPSLLEMARLHNSDLILLCRKQHKGLTYMLPGSIAERLVTHSPLPVFLVHEQGPLPIFPDIQRGQTIRALLGIDDPAQTGAVMRHTLALTASLMALPQSVIHLARVISPFATYNEQSYRSCMQETINIVREYQLHNIPESLNANEASSEASDEVLIEAVYMSWSIVSGIDYAHTFIEEADNGEPIEGSKDHAPFHILAISSLFGQHHHILHTGYSVVERITHETLLPVLIVPPQPVQIAPDAVQPCQQQVAEVIL